MATWVKNFGHQSWDRRILVQIFVFFITKALQLWTHSFIHRTPGERSQLNAQAVFYTILYKIISHRSFLFIFLKDLKLNKIIFIIYYVFFFKILSFSKLFLGETATWAPSSQETWGFFFNKIACFQMKFRETNIAMAMIPAQCKGDMFPLANWSNPE